MSDLQTMATSSKKTKVDIPDDYVSASGYVHNVTPMKVSRSGGNYFNGELQESSGFRTLVGYTPENQRKLAHMEKQKSPVKLSNVVKVASYRKLGAFDLKLHGRSIITEPTEKLMFSFDPPKMEDVPLLSIAAIKEIPENTRVSVNAKVVAFVETEEQKLKYKEKPITRVTYKIADDTGSMPCTFWGSDAQQITLNRCYSLTNVTVRIFGFKKLSTNPDSKIYPIEDIPDVEFKDEEDLPVTDIAVTGANVSTFMTCRFCQIQLVFNKELPTVKCTNCCKRQLVTSLKEVRKCQLDAEDDHTYVVPNQILQKVLPAGDMSDDDIELYFLTTVNFRITPVSPGSSTVAKIVKK